MSFVNFAQARREPALIDAGIAAGLNEHELRAAIIAEADTGSPATWARRAPGTTGNFGDALLQVDIDLAVAAVFVVTT